MYDFMRFHYGPMDAPDMYPPTHKREYRKRYSSACDNYPAGWWLQLYSPLLGRWNNIEFLGETAT